MSLRPVFVFAAALISVLTAPVASAQEVLIQVTQSSAGRSIRPSMAADGQRLVFQSNANLVGTNPDLNDEIFLWEGGVGLRQLTNTVGGSNISPSISDDGTRIAYASNRNPTGGNSDGSFELFLWRDATLTQLTNVATGDINELVISGNGTRIAYAATTNPIGANPDANEEIFLWREGSSTVQVTFSEGGNNSHPSISGDGNTLTFASNRNLGGGNEDLSGEVFIWTSPGSLGPLTSSSMAVNNFPSINRAGTRIVWHSDIDWFPGNNVDHSYELFLWTHGQGMYQVTTDVADLLGSVMPAFANFVPPNSRSAEVQRVVFRSDERIAGGNPDGNMEVWDWNNRTGVRRQLTNGNGSSVYDPPAIAAGGSHVAFADNSNPNGLNGDGNTEMWVYGPPSEVTLRNGFE